MGQAAARVARAVGAFVDGQLPVRIRAWDGSEAGAPADSGAPVVVLNHRRALRRLLWQPGEMGLAHAYVSGDLDVDGDLGEGLAAMWGLVRDGAIKPRRPRLGELPGLVGNAARLGLLGPKPAAPPEAITLPRFARLHSKLRDRAVIAHHYDAGNDFYELILDENMAYSSGYWADLAAPLDRANLVRRPGRQARHDLPQARAAARTRRCSTSGAAGARCPSTPRSTSARRSAG